jgi:hypothetical protein
VYIIIIIIINISHLSLYWVRNDICTTNLWQLLNNFMSNIHIVFLLPLIFFYLSLLFFTNKKKKIEGCLKSCHKIVVQISLFNWVATISVPFTQLTIAIIFTSISNPFIIGILLDPQCCLTYHYTTLWQSSPLHIVHIFFFVK